MQFIPDQTPQILPHNRLQRCIQHRPATIDAVNRPGIQLAEEAAAAKDITRINAQYDAPPHTVKLALNYGRTDFGLRATLAGNYLGLGAAAGLEIDRIALGRQAGAMAAALLRGNRIESVPLGFPNGMTVKTNPGVLRRLGSSFNASGFQLQ